MQWGGSTCCERREDDMQSTAVVTYEATDHCIRCGRPIINGSDLCLRCQRILERQAYRTRRRYDLRNREEVRRWRRDYGRI